ncbi:hypothetical protein FRC17_010146 [Serendipita sp. 399]|nr:hypothetical protein FRC17_010146 [Serendipita sp. 399]
MIIRKIQNIDILQATPLDRPFPNENTVAEIYCNEALTIDNEAVEDWTSSLQMLLTFAAIFSAVLITLIVDSKRLLEQDKTEVLVDAVVFLMNNLANGTHRPYDPPKFQPTTQSIVINCFFFASLCLSIATALAAVLAMQWVTDYGAVTRRAGSTPEERLKRRHFRYQGGKDWRMDTIIGALPIALHLSVLLFFVGLIVCMWDVHHSVFAVVVVCGLVAALFYVLTTILAIFYPSCPYRTPLASWLYILLHLLVKLVFPSSWLSAQQTYAGGDTGKGKEMDVERTSKLRQMMTSILSQLALPTLTSRDDLYVRSPDKNLMASSFVWLSSQLSISPDIYQRLLVFVDGFSSIVDPEAHLHVVPWKEIFRALGTTYAVFLETCAMKEEEFVEFARQTHCLSEPGLMEILESVLGSSEGGDKVGNPDFPVHLLRAWSKSTASHTSDALRSQRHSDEVVLRGVINDISSSSQVLMETWYSLLDEEARTTERVLSMILDQLPFGTKEQQRQKLDTTLYLISTGRLPWDSTVLFYDGTPLKRNLSSSALLRRLRAAHWVDSLRGHSQKEIVLRGLCDFKEVSSVKVLLDQIKLTPEEEARFGQMGLYDLDRRTHTKRRLRRALREFDRLYDGAEGIIAKQHILEWTLTVICEDLRDSVVSFDPKSLSKWEKIIDMQRLSNPVLRLIACATLGIEWEKKWTPDLLNVKDSMSDGLWQRVSRVCFRTTPFFDGDQTPVWALRLRLWVHLHPAVTRGYIYGVMVDFDLLKRIEQEIQSSQLGIDKAGDFLLAFFHLNHAYGWIYTEPYFYTVIVDILTQSIASREYHGVSTESIEHLSFICQEINADPARLVRLLIELIRADINQDPQDRRPQNLLKLLKHAETNFPGKELRPFSPSFRRLVRYIRVSYQQLESTWDEVLFYAAVNRGELKTVYERVVTLLEPSSDEWEGEVRDVSWPRYLLRPTGTEERPFEEGLEQGEAESNDKRNEDNDGNDEEDGNDDDDDQEDGTEEEHEDQTELRLDDQLRGNGRSLQEGTSAVIEGPVK